MSRIGKIPIDLPKGVTVNITDSLITVEGPKGKEVQDYQPQVGISVKENTVVVTRKNDSKKARAYHGLYRQLIRNMIIGVTTGFSRTLLISGVGYRAEIKGNILFLNLGYSNPIEFMVSDDIQVACDGQTKVIVSGINKQRVGQTAAEIRSLRPPEPYKGKGIKYDNEMIKRKIGKSGA
ncbi:MAG: 50S ribosomal protein L6 [Spirochaetales bacterium]|nr:50S ribosomal protein L6 [Spirochaetales bacterium]